MKNTNFFPSNELYSTFRRQKLMNVNVLTVHIRKNNGFFKNFNTPKKKTTLVLSKMGYLESLAHPNLKGNLSNDL